jgi:Acyltransferase family
MEWMLRKLDGSDQAVIAPARIVPLDRARTFIILLVLLHHAVINYTYFGHGDRMRWLGFDLVVLFNDSFFMAFMFFVSGLFVRDSLARKGAAIFLHDRARRLGVPYLVSVLVLMPVAYYPTFLRYHLPGTTDFNFLHFWWHTLTVGPWPSGPAWFLWVLLALDAMAAAVWLVAPRMIQTLGQFTFSTRHRPMVAFIVFLIVSTAAYMPMHLGFGDTDWLELGRFPLPIQTSRILLYAAYFFAGIGVAPSASEAACLRKMANWPGAGWSGSPLRSCSTLRFLFSYTPTITGWRISIRRHCCGTSATASHLRPTAPQWRSRCLRFFSASPNPAGACSMRCSPRPTASTSCTTSSSSGCNTPSMTIRWRPASSSRSFSRARWR